MRFENGAQETSDLTAFAHRKHVNQFSMCMPIHMRTARETQTITCFQMLWNFETAIAFAIATNEFKAIFKKKVIDRILIAIICYISRCHICSIAPEHR